MPNEFPQLTTIDIFFLIALSILDVSIYFLVESLIINLINKLKKVNNKKNEKRLKISLYTFLTSLAISLLLFSVQKNASATFINAFITLLNWVQGLIMLYNFYLIIKVIYLAIRKKGDIKKSLLRIIIFGIINFILIIVINSCFHFTHFENYY